MTALSVEPGYGEGTAYGKSVDELQSDIRIAHGIISGTLHAIDGYEQFSTNPDEQTGHYLALKFEAAEDATVKVNLVGGQKGEFALPPDDRSVVFLIRDTNKRSILATIEKEGHKKELTYALTGLTLEKPKLP